MRDNTAQADTEWYKPVMHTPDQNPIPKHSMGTMQIFHPQLLKMMRTLQPGAPEPSAPVPLSGRFAGSA